MYTVVHTGIHECSYPVTGFRGGYPVFSQKAHTLDKSRWTRISVSISEHTCIYHRMPEDQNLITP